MKRNIFYLAAVLVVGAVVFYLFRYRSVGTLNSDEQSFTIKDTAAVGKLFIADMQGNKIELTRSSNGWVMNGKQPASKEAVNMMLSTLNRMAVRYPVPDAARENVVTEMSSNNRKVVVFDRDGKEMKSILIGGPPLDYRGNYMIIEGADNPYVVEIPGFQGSLETRFSTDTTRLRNPTIISVPFNALVEVGVMYHETQDSSFVIDMSKSDSFSVYNPVTQVSLPRKAVDKNKLFAYVNLLKQVNVESYENENPTRAELLSQKPFCTVAIKLRDGNKILIDCYNKPVDRRSKAQFDPSGNPIPFDLDRFYGLVNGKDFVLLQRYHFGQLLKSVSYFKV